MSGHSHWASIKHKKQLTDNKKGKIFSKIAKMIAIAARKGGNPGMNPSLRLIIEKAKSVNMPNDNIERAIKKGTGEDKEGQLEEVLYEAYGPGGAALIIEVITDNKNRTISEVRHLLSQYNGRLGETGSVKWMFEQKGVIEINPEGKNKEELELAAIDAGADDIKSREEFLEIQTKPENLEKVKESIEKTGIKIENISLDWVPKNEIELKDETPKKQLENLFESLDENEDVKEIYCNVKF